MSTRKSGLLRTCAFLVTAATVLTVNTGCPTGPSQPTVPAIGLSAASLTFSAAELGANPPGQTIQLSNAGVGTLEWTCADDADWLSVTPDIGTTTTDTVDLTVSVDIVSLAAAGSPYTAQITVSATGASNTPRTVDVTLILTALTCESLSGTIDTDTTLPAGCYLVESSVSVTGGAMLTIEQGVIIKFQQDAGMTVRSDGRLSAVGTAEQPIIFTGEEAVRGYWDGLDFSFSNSFENRLDHVTIEYGGGYRFFGWESARTNLMLNGSSSAPVRVEVTNCTLRESAGWGIWIDDDATVNADIETANTFAGNTGGDVFREP